METSYGGDKSLESTVEVPVVNVARRNETGQPMPAPNSPVGWRMAIVRATTRSGPSLRFEVAANRRSRILWIAVQGGVRRDSPITATRT